MHFCCPFYHVECTSVVVLLIMLGVLVVGRTPSYHVGCTSGVVGHTSGYVECTVCYTLSIEIFPRLHAFMLYHHYVYMFANGRLVDCL